ncbi:MAG: PAS domain-containing protein [Bacteroidota bacterium]
MNIYEEIFNNSLDAKCILDEHSQIVAYNSAFAEIFVCDNSCKGKPFESVTNLQLNLALFDNKNYKLNIKYKNPKNDTFYLEVSCLTINQMGKKLFCFFFENNTEKLLQEFALQDAEIEKEAILDYQTDFVIVQDLDYNILWANKSATEGSNLTLQEMLYRKCYEIWSDDNSPCENCSVFRVKQTLKPEEFIRKTKNGTYWLIKASPIFNKDGKLHRILEIAENITQKKEQERIIAENEAQYRTLAKYAPVGIIVFDNLVPVFANPKALDILEFQNVKELSIAKLLNYIYPDDYEYFQNFIEMMREYRLKDENVTIKFRLERNHKIKYIISTVSYFNVLDKNYYQIILIDNTELAELSAIQRKLAVESVYLNEKNKLIEELNKRHKLLAKKYNFSDEDVRRLNKLLNSYFLPERDWEITKKHFEAVHKNFFTNLKKKFPNLTQNELRHCAYIRMNYTTKEIARILNVAPSSVQKARLRLKKKLKLNSHQDLYLFIMSI